MGDVLAPDRILRELDAMWMTLAKPGEGETGAGVLRACSMTLVVLAEESENVTGFGETVAALMPEHPARAILIRLRPGAERVLADRVYAQCWMPFGQRRQICCEQVEIGAGDVFLPDLPSLLVPLVAPDLPVVLWGRSARLFTTRGFSGLAGLAQKVIVDSAGLALEIVASARAEGLPLADLSWTRTSRWREVLSRVFDNRAYLDGLSAVTALRITFGGSSPPPCAWYLAAWVLDGLRQAGSSAEPSFERAPGAGPPGLDGVALEGGGLDVSIRASASGCVEIRAGGVVQRTAFPAPGDYLLMREELSIPARDPVFDGVLPQAMRLTRDFQL